VSSLGEQGINVERPGKDFQTNLDNPVSILVSWKLALLKENGATQ
jgi:hypothetical protein